MDNLNYRNFSEQDTINNVNLLNQPKSVTELLKICQEYLQQLTKEVDRLEQRIQPVLTPVGTLEIPTLEKIILTESPLQETAKTINNSVETLISRIAALTVRAQV